MIQIVPAIDIIGGKCVRLTQGDYGTSKIYNENPLEVAKQMEGAGIKRLHVVDLDGAKNKKIINHSVLEKICKNTSLEVDFGGGLQSDEDLKIAFESGAKQITGGSIAIKQPQVFENWINTFGTEKIILGADCKSGMIAISGWEETTQKTVYDLIEDYLRKGITYCICTDVAKDGLLQGPSLELYQEIIHKFPTLKLIASGGVAEISDIDKLNDIGCYGVIFGKAFYEGRITLDQLKPYLQ